MKIRVDLAEQDIGSVAIVSTRRWFIGWDHRKFTLVRSDALFGARWFDEDGHEADHALTHEINDAAQAEVNKRLVRLTVNPKSE